PTAAPTATEVPTPEATATVSPTAAPTATEMPTPTATAKVSPTAAPTATEVPTPEATATVSPTAVPTATEMPTPEATATVSPTAAPTATEMPTPTATATVSPTAAPTATEVPTPAATAAVSPTAVPVPTMAQTAAPASPAPRPSRMNFAAMQQLMPDIRGWIVIPDTNINYPIVQGVDNEFYLNHLPDGTLNRSGSIMLDMGSASDWSDTVSILHGHHMRSGDMFGSLHAFEDAAYAAQHAVWQLYTPQGDWQVELIAACEVDGSALGYPANFTDDAAFTAFLDGLTSRSAYRCSAEVTREDHLVLLSTCAYSFENARFIVLGRLIPE
ncbi:MAG: sortase, partial [Clostridia bacterium]|nr:sortase [Clostridia bacterium]